MSEPTFVGRCYIWGLDGTLAYTGIATSENEMQSMTYKDDCQRHDSKDKKGRTVGVQLWNPNPKVTIKFMPCVDAASGAIATAKTKLQLPPRGSRVTLAGFPPDIGTGEDLDQNPGINSATWIYFQGGEITFNNEKEVEMSLPLERFETNIAEIANT